MTKQEQFDQQSITEHLAELRSCFIVSLLAVCACFALTYICINPIAEWFLRPLTSVLPDNKPLIFTAYQEGFFFI